MVKEPLSLLAQRSGIKGTFLKWIVKTTHHLMAMSFLHHRHTMKGFPNVSRFLYQSYLLDISTQYYSEN